MVKTSLYDWHRSNSNNIIPFSGYLLPVYYTSIVDEHLSVRKKAGLFDVLNVKSDQRKSGSTTASNCT